MICWFQLLKCLDLLLSFVTYDSKLSLLNCWLFFFNIIYISVKIISRLIDTENNCKLHP